MGGSSARRSGAPTGAHLTPNQRDGWRVVLTVMAIAFGAWIVIAAAALLVGCDVPRLEGCNVDADCPAGEPAGYDGPYPHAGYHYRCDGYRCFQVEECAPPAKPPDAPVLIPPGFYTPPIPESETAMGLKDFFYKIPIIVQQGADIDASGKIKLPDDNEPPKASNINIVGEQLASVISFNQSDSRSRFITGNGPGATYTPITGPIIIDGTGFGGVIGAPLTAAPSQATGILVQSPIDAREGVVVREGIRLLGGDPAPSTDVGANDLYFSTNIPKAWVCARIDNGTVTVQGGANIASVELSNTNTEAIVSFVRPLANIGYAAVVTVGGANSTAVFATLNDSGKAPDSFRINAWRRGDPGSAVIDLTTVDIILSVMVMGTY